MTENANTPREFIIEHARNGAVIVTCRESGETLGGYQDRFEALSAIASDWGFCIERGSEGMGHAMGHGFHQPHAMTDPMGDLDYWVARLREHRATGGQA